MKTRFFAVVAACVCFVSFSAKAQVDRNFTNRASFDTYGGIELIGNVLITCDGTGSCGDIQSGTSNGNNNLQTAYVNQDPGAGFSNSSSATLNLPAGSDVLYAGLYWGGRFASSGGGANARRTINIRPPGAANYTAISVGGGNLDAFTSQGSDGNRPYQVWADITSIVDSNGSGQYFVGGLSANNGEDGLGFYGGWSIVVIYEDFAQASHSACACLSLLQFSSVVRLDTKMATSSMYPLVHIFRSGLLPISNKSIL